MASQPHEPERNALDKLAVPHQRYACECEILSLSVAVKERRSEDPTGRAAQPVVHGFLGKTEITWQSSSSPEVLSFFF